MDKKTKATNQQKELDDSLNKMGEARAANINELVKSNEKSAKPAEIKQLNMTKIAQK